MLKKITVLPDKIPPSPEYPFSVPAIASLRELSFKSRVCFFTGENGSGKSTLLEALAAHYGFGREGGNRNFVFSTTGSNRSIDPLVRALRLTFDIRTGAGFFLRAESFFHAASYVDQVGAEFGYGGRSLHERSHGESFLTLLENKFTGNGLFLLDEPEAALSPQRQLSCLALIHHVLRERKGAQFIISTHSPILLAFPEAQILSFDDGQIREIDYKETGPYQIVRTFLSDPDRILRELFREEGNLFDGEIPEKE